MEIKNDKIDKVRVGWGEKDIIFTGGKIYIAGCVPFRTTDIVHDNIKATAMVLQSENRRIIWVSCDFCHPTKQVEDRIIELLSEQLDDFCPNDFILSATHASACFYISDKEVISSEHLLEKSNQILSISCAREQFCSAVVCAVIEAINNLEDEQVKYRSFEIKNGFCRRPVYKDDSAVMYGSVQREDFLEMEYPDRYDTDAIYFYENGTQNLKGVLVATPCPAQADESSRHITADFWGYTRKYLNDYYGAKVKVLALCKSAGELSPHNLFAKDVQEQWGEKTACNIGEEIAKNLIKHDKTSLKAQPIAKINHLLNKINLPASKISKQEYLWAKNYIENNNEDQDSWVTYSNAKHIYQSCKNNVQFYSAKASVVQIGDIVLFTAPAELFTQYAKEILSRFDSQTIIDVQLTHDSIGYLSTEKAVRHGGYSAFKFNGFCDSVGGNLFVNKTIQSIKEIIS